MWQAARRWSTWTSSALVVLAVAGCGTTWQPAFESHELDQRLLSFGFPADHIHGAVIRSRGFTADHMSVYDLSPAAKKAIWDRTDRLIAAALHG